jgi:hypothetical protein
MLKIPFDMSKEEQYTKAFNNGYILAEHEPKLLEAITQNLASSTPYLEGFFAGKEEYALELSNNKELSALRAIETLRAKSNRIDKDFNIERDF